MHMMNQRSVGFVAAALLVVAVLSVVPTASAGAGVGAAAPSDAEPQCYQVYFGEVEAGPVTVDASDSCVEVHVDGASSSSIPPCGGIYDDTTTTVGPVTTGVDPFCSPYVEVDGSSSEGDGDVTGPVDPVEDALGVDCHYDKDLQGWCVFTGSSDLTVTNHGTGVHCDYDPKTLTGYCYFD